MIRTATPRPAASFKAPVDDGGGLGAEVEVVLRQVERALCGREERRELARHVERLLAAVGQSSGSDGGAHRASWPTPGSARPSTSIVTGGEPPGAGTVCAPTSSPGARRRCSSSERPRATAGPASPGSRSPRSGSSPAAARPRRRRRSCGVCSPSSSSRRRRCCWNVVPTHPHRPGCPATNRRPTRAEIEAARPFLRELARGRRTIAVGRLAQSALGGPYVRHPSHGGAAEFRGGLLAFRPGGQESAAFSE